MRKLNLRSIPSALACLGAAAVALTGCSNMVTTASESVDPTPAAVLSGTVHGGQQPVYNATVSLWAAGSSGYGSAATKLATTTSSLTGAFQFTKLATTGASAGNTSTWQCPSTGNPQIYLTAIGGNTQGTGVTSTNNTASALIAAIGPCSSVSTSTQVGLNEISTVATVYALAQYMNPGTTPGTESIGTNSTALAATGLNNAVSTIANLANVSTGSTVTPPTYTGTNSAAGVTVTAIAETAKLITIANILGSCINTPSASSANCADLFASAAPPTASTTSQPSATFSTATDTIQAAYYLATNPANNGTFTSCNNGGTTKTSCLYGLVAATSAAFGGSLATAPTDWTLGVTYSASGTCAGGGPFISAAYHAAVDGSGNLWFINGVASGANLSEMSPAGQPLTCQGNLAAGRGMTIDANGNVWGSFNGTTTNGVLEIPGGSPTATPVAWSVGAAVAPYSMTADGFGNVFINVNATGGSLYEWVNPNTNTTPFAPTQIAGPFNGTSTTTLGYLQVDPLNRIWDSTSTVSFLYDIYPKASAEASITGYAINGGFVTFTAANTFAAGNVVQVSGLTTAEGMVLDNQTYTLTAATATSFTAALAPSGLTIAFTPDTGTAIQPGVAASYSTASLATSIAAYGMAIDSNNYLYQGTTCCGSGAAYREALKWTPGAAGTATNTYSTTNFGGMNGIRSVAVDGASNFWLGQELPSSLNATATTGTYSVIELATSGSGASVTYTPLSPAGTAPTVCTTSAGCPTGGGYYDNDFLYAQDMEIDPSGNLWVLNTGFYETSTTNGLTITELVGAAVPVVTPISTAVRNSQLATKP